ncbi:MAG TPA: hypothetical protein VG714_03605 [Acidobacteriaceae bacterium]|nr:hypothetical protein [Acidobacteriaceae bacterium]
MRAAKAGSVANAKIAKSLTPICTDLTDLKMDLLLPSLNGFGIPVGLFLIGVIGVKSVFSFEKQIQGSFALRAQDDDG